MGVRSLWKILKPSAQLVTPSSCRLAIDASIWMHQYKGLKNEDIVYFFSKRVVKLLHHGISPLFVFDGETPELKRHVVEQRKREGARGIARAVVEDRTCRVCGVKMRMCKHASVLRKELMDEVDDRVIEAMQSHGYNWGDVWGGEELTVPVGRRDPLNIDFVRSKKLTRSEKLRRLVDLREKRKERMEYSTASMSAFSESQLENLKKRNLISHNIRKLEAEVPRRLQHDCRRTYELVKEGKERSIEEYCVKLESINAEGAKEDVDEDLHELFGTKAHEKRMGSRAIAPESYLGDSHRLREMLDGHMRQDVEPVAAKEDEGDVVEVRYREERSAGGFFATEMGEESTSSGEFVEDALVMLGEGNVVKHADIPLTGERPGDYINEASDDLGRVLVQIKAALDAFGIPYFEAPMEADAQCGYLSMENVVDGVVTEDNDVLLYGGVVYRNFFRRNKHIERYSLGQIESSLGLSRKDLVRMSYLLGSDYTVGVRGIGPVKAVEQVKRGGVRDEDIPALLQLYYSPTVRRFGAFKNTKLSPEKLAAFFHRSSLGPDRTEELMFFICRLMGSNPA
jgi:hypothetical protein